MEIAFQHKQVSKFALPLQKLLLDAATDLHMTADRCRNMTPEGSRIRHHSNMDSTNIR